MVEGMDYGKIPGCEKPTLFKPGAEKLGVTFRLNGNPTIEDLGTPDEARFRVKTEFIHIPTGQSIGFGVGEASSDEEKYKWRKAVSAAEWDATPEDRRRFKYYRDGEPGKQVRTNVADIRNTVLKMADKRSYISGTLKSTAASSIFTQDLEDLNEDLRSVVAGEDKVASPIATPEAKKAEAPSQNGVPAQTAARSAKERMRKMDCKFDSRCRACTKVIKKGEPIYYDGITQSAYHPDCA